MSAGDRHILVIGIGAGDPGHLTLAAVAAMRRADVFFVLDKGSEKDGLIRLRRQLLDQHVGTPYRLVEGEDPERDRSRQSHGPYTDAVRDWRHRRADVCERLISEELAPGECGAFLVWGDPGLYDSTLGILREIRSRGTVTFGYEVVPGISSVSALTAAHGTPLNQVGGPVLLTPGRLLDEGIGSADDVVVMLDAHQRFTGHTDEDLWIYWGAYVGTEDEILVSGPLDRVAGRIVELRAEARARHGWIMDTYLLRRSRPGEEPHEEPGDSTGVPAGGDRR
ncbi:precorrin 6A synthase [Streptomyces abyssalis]|uniref:Precorrin 6A synthase n=1 Tax=Streptomyces abyssalis TaxID=933944 RepID=A0A1E7JGN5_9ACTN|nr:precorrin-6A synthase (deacetylating) [Streptomyces abyssalis]OEU85623.1 precorrin 6A synthase [Streptomyces abyssalis]OEU92912.1 precorrin 6A synthase [Streptomyces abyssalis]